MRLTFLFFICFISLFGRDNPFFPADPNEKQVTSSNKIETLQPYTTQKISLPNSARAIKAITIRYQNMDGSISNEELELNNKIDWHEPFVISQASASTESIKNKKLNPVIDVKFIKFKGFDKSLKIITKDKILRHFMLTTPHRIVMDFSRDTSFKPKHFPFATKPFTNIRMGNHDRYYRVVIELDGQYRYKLQVNEKDYTIVCF